VLLIVDALRERQRREAGAATKESGPPEGQDSQGDEEDYPAGPFDESEEAAAPADSSSDEDAADSVSDDHNTR
jgi:hypothetical protein